MPPKEETMVDSVGSTPSIPSGADINIKTTHDHGGYCLRWSRLRKTVEIQDVTGGGLVRGSIAGDSRSRSTDARPSMTATKDILSGVSGYAAPGELLACMGPSGSGCVRSCV